MYFSLTSSFICEIEVLVAVGHKIIISGDFEPHGLVEEEQHFEGTCCPYHQHRE